MEVIEKVGSWGEPFSDLFESEGMGLIMKWLDENQYFPHEDEVFKCFQETDFMSCKVVFLGLCPYHTMSAGTPYANGLAFDCSAVSWDDGSKITPSFQKILDEYNRCFPSHFSVDIMSGGLHRWAKQGVLLMNAALTVQPGRARSHNKLWSPFTRGFISRLSKRRIDPPLVVAFGNDAYDLCKLEDYPRLIKVVHPSYSARNGFEWTPFGDEGFFHRIDKELRTEFNW